MDYRQLMTLLDLDTIREIARQREVRCSYLRDDEQETEHREIIVKTLLAQMESPDNIRKSLMRLNEHQLRLLHQILESERVDDADPELISYGFFLSDCSGTAVFHEDVETCLADMERVRVGHVDPDQPVADRLAYGTYLALLNGLLTRRIKCLINQQPGKRMVECLRDRVPGGVTDDGVAVLYGFLLHSNLLAFDPEDGQVIIPDTVPDRGFFYTNLFKYLQSGEMGHWLDQFKDATEGDPTVLLSREQLEIPEKVWHIFCLTDTVKPMADNTFVITDLAAMFLAERTVVLPPSASGFFVVPGFKLIADRSADEALLSTLIRITELERFDQVFQFAFNSCSLIHARRQGFSESDIVQFLKHNAACPDDLERMIQDTLARYGEIQIFAGYHAILSENPALLDRLTGEDEIGRYVQGRSENALIVDPAKSSREVQRLLVDLDFIPELHVNEHHIPVHRADMKDVHHFLNRARDDLKREPGPELDRLNTLFDKLRMQPDDAITPASPAGPDGAIKTDLAIEKSGTMNLEERMEILQFAMSRRYRIRIRYKQKGTELMEDRLIAPRYFDGDFLIAYCENRQAERRFNVYRLELIALIVEDKQ